MGADSTICDCAARRADQTDNSQHATLANAMPENVADRIEVRTAESLAIHNISCANGRRQVLDQAVRVLRPGGRLAIADSCGTPGTTPPS